MTLNQMADKAKTAYDRSVAWNDIDEDVEARFYGIAYLVNHSYSESKISKWDTKEIIEQVYSLTRKPLKIVCI